MVKDPPAMQETQFQSLGQEDPWRREWLPTPVFLPGKPHGQRNLLGYIPWSHKESDMTVRLTISLFFQLSKNLYTVKISSSSVTNNLYYNFGQLRKHSNVLSAKINKFLCFAHRSHERICWGAFENQDMLCLSHALILPLR